MRYRNISTGKEPDQSLNYCGKMCQWWSGETASLIFSSFLRISIKEGLCAMSADQHSTVNLDHPKSRSTIRVKLEKDAWLQTYRQRMWYSTNSEIDRDTKVVWRAQCWCIYLYLLFQFRKVPFRTKCWTMAFCNILCSFIRFIVWHRRISFKHLQIVEQQ